MLKKYACNKEKNISLNIKKLDANKIYKILELFNYNNIAIFIDSLEVESSLYKKIKDLNIKYNCFYKTKDNLYESPLLFFNRDDVDILKEIINTDNDLFIFDFIEQTDTVNIFNNLEHGNLIKNNISTFTIDLWRTENKAYISYNNICSEYKNINDKIKQILYGNQQIR